MFLFINKLKVKLKWRTAKPDQAAMGKVESRFKESIQVGDSMKAYELYYNKKALRDSVNPKEKCYPGGSTLLHQTALHAMQPLYETFLDHPNADPLELTENGQSCLHLICSRGNDSEIRKKMLINTLNHENVSSHSGYLSQCDKVRMGLICTHALYYYNKLSIL